MKIKPIAFSFAVSIILSFVFLMAIFWIVYVYSGDLTAIKDALNTTGSYFGGIATLAAAVVAAYLFSDWRVEKRFDQYSSHVEKITTEIINIHIDFDPLYFIIRDLNLESFKNKEILISNYELHKENPTLNTLIKLHHSIELFVNLSNDSALMLKYLKYENSIIFIRKKIQHFLKNIYPPYVERLGICTLDDKNVTINLKTRPLSPLKITLIQDSLNDINEFYLVTTGYKTKTEDFGVISEINKTFHEHTKDLKRHKKEFLDHLTSYSRLN